MLFEKEIRQLYRQSFPKLERVHFHILKNIVHRKCGKFYPITINHKFLGFFFAVKSEKLTYLFFFALKKEVRNKGYGSQALLKILSKFKEQKICLLTEMIRPREKDEIRIRRKNFYLRHHFKESGYFFKENNVWYEMLCTDDHFIAQDYIKLMKNAFSKLEYRFFFKPQGYKKIIE